MVKFSLLLPISLVIIERFCSSWSWSRMRLPVSEAHAQLLATKVRVRCQSISTMPMLQRVWYDDRAVVWVRFFSHLIKEVLCHGRLARHSLIRRAAIKEDVLISWVGICTIIDASASMCLGKWCATAVEQANNHAVRYWGEDHQLLLKWVWFLIITRHCED